jgi:SAM-dependent methyltransferase
VTTSDDASKPHSAEYFGEQRDFWWNADFIALMARRWQLDRVRMALDVGAGVGHWGRLLFPHLAPEARLFGIDREEAWIREANARAADLHGRAVYRFGEAERIPFHDGVFDLVTCQTVLIHVPDPRAVIREMMRVLAPGGLLAVAEPNNLAEALVRGSTLFRADPERSLSFVRLQLTCQSGKEALGEGHNSVGDLLPGYFAEAGLTEVTAHVSDKAASLIPPYRGREQEVRRDQILDWIARDHLVWDRRDTRRYFLAGGGSEEDFERLWASARAAAQDTAAALRAGTEHMAGGGVHYLVSGRKPATSP